MDSIDKSCCQFGHRCWWFGHERDHDASLQRSFLGREVFERRPPRNAGQQAGERVTNCERFEIICPITGSYGLLVDFPVRNRGLLEIDALIGEVVGFAQQVGK